MSEHDASELIATFHELKEKMWKTLVWIIGIFGIALISTIVTASYTQGKQSKAIEELTQNQIDSEQRLENAIIQLGKSLSEDIKSGQEEQAILEGNVFDLAIVIGELKGVQLGSNARGNKINKTK